MPHCAMLHCNVCRALLCYVPRSALHCAMLGTAPFCAVPHCDVGAVLHGTALPHCASKLTPKSFPMCPNWPRYHSAAGGGGVHYVSFASLHCACCAGQHFVRRAMLQHAAVFCSDVSAMWRYTACVLCHTALCVCCAALHAVHRAAPRSGTHSTGRCALCCTAPWAPCRVTWCVLRCSALCRAQHCVVRAAFHGIVFTMLYTAPCVLCSVVPHYSALRCAALPCAY